MLLLVLGERIRVVLGRFTPVVWIGATAAAPLDRLPSRSVKLPRADRLFSALSVPGLASNCASGMAVASGLDTAAAAAAAFAPVAPAPVTPEFAAAAAAADAAAVSVAAADGGTIPAVAGCAPATCAVAAAAAAAAAAPASSPKFAF